MRGNHLAVFAIFIKYILLSVGYPDISILVDIEIRDLEVFLRSPSTIINNLYRCPVDIIDNQFLKGRLKDIDKVILYDDLFDIFEREQRTIDCFKSYVCRFRPIDFRWRDSLDLSEIGNGNVYRILIDRIVLSAACE